MTFLFPRTERNLILTGDVGSEQPQLGQQIAEQLRMPFVNLETEITNRINLSGEEIRAYYGETHLKAVEAEIVRETALRRGTVIRVDGRTLGHSDHLTHLQATGLVICLVMELGAMLQHWHVSMGARYHDIQERAVRLAELKQEWAVRAMDGVYALDITPMTQEEIIARLVELWREVAAPRG